MANAVTSHERKLVEAALELRSSLCSEDEYDEQDRIDKLNDALEPYGYGRVKQRVMAKKVDR